MSQYKVLYYVFSNIKIIVFLAIIFFFFDCILLDCPFDGQTDDPSFAYESIDPKIEQDHIFYHDKYDRTIRLCVNISIVYKNKKRKVLENNLNKAFSAEYENMDRGHILPHRYGGTISIKNIVAQNSRLNRVAWRQFENQINVKLQTLNYVYYTVRLIYDVCGDGEACSSSKVFNYPNTFIGTIYDEKTIFYYIIATNPRGNEKSKIKYPEYTANIIEREQLAKSESSEFYSVLSVKYTTAGLGCKGNGICSKVHDCVAQCLKYCGTLSTEHHCIAIEMSNDQTCYQCVSGRRDIYTI